MTNLAVLGFVLHRRLIGETSIQATFLTQEQGLIRARVKGGRKQLKQALLQPFIPLWLFLNEHASGFYVRELQVQACLGELPQLAMIPALYLNELLYRFLQPQEEDRELFALYEHTLQGLMTVESQVNVEIILRQFEWYLLEMSGSLVSFTYQADGRCPIVEEQCYQLYPGKGFVPAELGVEGRDILAIAAGRWENESTLKVAKRMMRRLIQDALQGASIHTRELY